ncbi:MAG TPA: hypothetical protein ENK75_04455 [Saprospiraceae bacterium]|nr:hypothetical protein [Saprospiraceae bacterium]
MTNLSGIHLVTLGGKEVIFTKEQLIEAIEDSTNGKVKTPIGVLSLETPVRRNQLRRIPFDQIKDICGIARAHGIALHLDGARLFIDAAFSGKEIREYTSLFDTVYLSLYKSFNAVSGAIMAGDAALIDGLHNERRMFGGGLPSSWEQVAVANYFFDGYEKRYQKAKELFRELTKQLQNKKLFEIESLQHGSNVFKMTPLRKIDPDKFEAHLAKNGIKFPHWNAQDACYYIKMNDSLVFHRMDKVVQIFAKG